MLQAYEEIVDFIATGTTPAKVIAFRPSSDTQSRVETLIRQEKNAGLSVEEKAELDNYLQLEHLMRLAKIKALAHLSHE